MSEEADDSALLGQLLADRYRIEALLGRGGMGTVWRATDQRKNRVVAVKLIRPQYAEQEEARRRFEIEAHAAASVQSDHAVQVFDYGMALGRPYIAMEYLEGESLAETVARTGPVPLGTLGMIVEQATDALSKAHSKNIIHRDLKPDNVFLATNVRIKDARLGFSVKVVDFGIAKLLDATNAELSGPTQTGMVIGTPTFMSPEQLTQGGQPDVLMDIWAMGVTVFTAATGRLPFESELMGELVLQVCTLPMPIPSHINRNLPADFDRWFERACARDRNERFRSMRELSEALSMFADPEAQESVQLRLTRRSDVPSVIPEPAEHITSRMAIGLGVVLGVSILMALVGAIAWHLKSDQETVAPATHTQ